MAKHKTSHRKALEAHQKALAKARADELANLDPHTLKPNAAANLKAATKTAKKS